MIETQDITRPPAELVAKLQHIGTATATSTLARMGIRNSHIVGPVARTPGIALPAGLDYPQALRPYVEDAV